MGRESRTQRSGPKSGQSRTGRTAASSRPDGRDGGRRSGNDGRTADPSQSPEIRGRRGRAIAARCRIAVEWDAAHGDEPYDPDRFRREILPGLAGVKLVDIMAATGWSKSFASRVRAGGSVPHVSTWRALANLEFDGAAGLYSAEAVGLSTR